jgi:ribose transport system substrate-binding protein
MTNNERLYLIPILSKALDVLELLERQHGPVGLEEIHGTTQISRTSLYRILKTLAHRGYVSQAQNGQYRLAARPRRLHFGLNAPNAETAFAAAVIQGMQGAAAAAGVELTVLDNGSQPEGAIRNATELTAKGVDLAFGLQIEDRLAARMGRIFRQAGIPLVAIDAPLPHATYFGTDNFEAGFEAGLLLAQYAARQWAGKVDWVLGVGFGAGSFLQSRIGGAFEAIRGNLGDIPADHFVELDGRGARQPSQLAMAEFLRHHRNEERILAAAGTDSSALGALDAVRLFGREREFAMTGQNCTPEAIEEMRTGKSALIGSISFEAASYGPRLIHLGIALVRGAAVPPYNYAPHKVVTTETLGAEPSRRAQEDSP